MGRKIDKHVYFVLIHKIFQEPQGQWFAILVKGVATASRLPRFRFCDAWRLESISCLTLQGSGSTEDASGFPQKTLFAALVRTGVLLLYCPSSALAGKLPKPDLSQGRLSLSFQLLEVASSRTPLLA